jgi:branched-subunit amino acid transport protein
MILADILMILGMIFVTYSVRALPFIFADIALSPITQKMLEKVPAAVLAALVVEPIFNPVVENSNIFQPELIAALICLLVGLSGAHLLITVILGMASYWCLSLLI